MRKGSKKHRLTFDIPGIYSVGGGLSFEEESRLKEQDRGYALEDRKYSNQQKGISAGFDIAGSVLSPTQHQGVQNTGNSQLDYYNAQMQHDQERNSKIGGTTLGLVAAGAAVGLGAPQFAGQAFGAGNKVGSGIGGLFAEGGNLTYYNTGGTHEQNANGGVVLGNTGNSVEEGEYRMDDRVLSKKLGYADQMKKWEKKSKLRPNDSLTKELIAQKFDKLYEQQEAFKKQAQVQAQEQTMYAAYGGKLGFGGVGELDNPTLPALPNTALPPADSLKATVNKFAAPDSNGGMNLNPTMFNVAGTTQTVNPDGTISRTIPAIKSINQVNKPQFTGVQNTATPPTSTYSQEGDKFYQTIVGGQGTKKFSISEPLFNQRTGKSNLKKPSTFDINTGHAFGGEISGSVKLPDIKLPDSKPQYNTDLKYNNKGLNLGAGVSRKDMENAYRANAGYALNKFKLNTDYNYNKKSENPHSIGINTGAVIDNFTVDGNYNYSGGQHNEGLNLKYDKNNLHMGVGANYNKKDGTGVNFNISKKFNTGGFLGQLTEGEEMLPGGDLKSPYSVKDSTTIVNKADKDKNIYELKVGKKGDRLYQNGKEINFGGMNALTRDAIRLKLDRQKIASGVDPNDPTLFNIFKPRDNSIVEQAEGGNLGDMMSTPGFERAPLATKDFVLKPGNQTPKVNSEYVSMIPAFHNSMNVLPKTNSKSNKYKYSIGSNPDGVSDMISQYFYSEPQQLQNNPYNKRYLQNLHGQQLPQYYQNQHQQYLQQNNNPSEFILDVTPTPSYENNYMRDKNNKVINPGLQEGKQEPVQTPITTTAPTVYAQNTRQVPQMGTPAPAQDNMNFAAYGGQLDKGGKLWEKTRKKIKFNPQDVNLETDESVFTDLQGLVPNTEYDASMLSNENPNNPSPYSLPEGVVANSARRLPMDLMPTTGIKGGFQNEDKKLKENTTKYIDTTNNTTDKKTDTKSNVPQNKYSPLGMIAQAASPLYQGALGLLNKDTVNFEAPTLQGINPYYQARLQEAQINEQLNASRNAFRNNANTQGAYLAGVTNLGAFGADTAGRQIGEIYGQANQYNNSINNQNIAARVANANLNQDTRQREKDASRTAINMALQGAGQGIATGVKDKYAAQSNNLYNTEMSKVFKDLYKDFHRDANGKWVYNTPATPAPTITTPTITVPPIVPSKYNGKKYGGSLYKRGGKLMNYC